jgi:Xaa-Pro aminopeptidase
VLLNEQRAAKLMDEAGLEGLVATRLENVFYLSGVWNVSQTMFPYDAQTYAVVTRDRLCEPMVVIGLGDSDQTLGAFPGFRGGIAFGTFYREIRGNPLDEREGRLKSTVLDVAPRKDALDALVAVLEEMGLAAKTVGLDETVFPAAWRPELQRRLPNLSLHDAASLFRTIRMVKTEEEVRRLRRAAEITEEAIRASTAHAREGTTEQEVARAYQHSIIDQGGLPTFHLIRFGRNAVFGQLPSDDTPLRPGDAIWFDVGCLLDGYWSDLARMYVLGEPSEQLRRYYAASLKGEDHGIAFVRPGVTAEQIFESTVNVVREAGIGHYRRQHVGHGIGVEVYDPPLVAPGRKDVVEVGMVINFETPYFELGWGSVHVEDPFVVREHGNELLTTSSRDLRVIPI